MKIIKKILISVFIRYPYDEEFSHNMIVLLNDYGYEIEIISNKKFNIERYAKFVSKVNEDYDLAIGLNKIGLNRIKSLKSNNIPIFYFITAPAYYEERVKNTLYDKLFLIGTQPTLETDDIPVFINIPYVNSSADFTPDTNCSGFSLSFKGAQTTYSVIRIINTNIFNKIDIYSSTKIFKNLLNTNVRILKSVTEQNASIKKAEIVIGEQEAVIKAILYCKPVLVLGEYGYGGVVNEINFNKFLASGFKGRIGGVQNESLPMDLILYDLMDLEDKDFNKTALSLKKRMIEYLNNQSELFLKLIAFYSTLNKKNIAVIKLIRNKLFQYNNINSKKTVYLSNRLTGQLVYELNKYESFILYLFDEYQFISEVKSKYINMGYISFDRKLAQLIKSKILVYEM